MKLVSYLGSQLFTGLGWENVNYNVYLSINIKYGTTLMTLLFRAILN